MRDVIRQLPGSKIRKVANAGLGRSDVLAFWFGEGDEATPGFIREAAVASLARGETYYANLGLPGLPACRPAGAGRQADRVQHLLRAGVRAAGGPGLGAGGRPAGAGLLAHLRDCRDTLLPALQAPPAGGLYAFFRVAGETDSMACAKRLVVQVGLGLAPGAAFGPEAEGWLRWCFASRDPARLMLGVGRLRRRCGYNWQILRLSGP